MRAAPADPPRERRAARRSGLFLLARLAATAGLIALYCRADWAWLCVALRDAWSVPLRALGHTVTPLDAAAGAYLLIQAGHATPERLVHLTANCTYADLVLAAAPFCWAAGRRVGANLLRLAGLVALVLSFNLVRLTLTVEALDWGLPWRLAHDAPDLLVHGSVLGAVLVSWLKAERGGPPAASPGQSRDRSRVRGNDPLHSRRRSRDCSEEESQRGSEGVRSEQARRGATACRPNGIGPFMTKVRAAS